jgi:dolichyl-phosphate beta-glucosyltransferase
MWGFHFLVSFLCVKGIKDTQCGFKLFTRKSAQQLFPNMHVERWAFDVELLYLYATHYEYLTLGRYAADARKIPMVEVPVNWTEIPGSKLSPLAASIQMAKDLLRIRLAYMLGIWKLNN